MHRSRTFRFLIALLLLAAIPFAQRSPAAAPVLVADDIDLRGEAIQMALHTWLGRPAVSVVTRRQAEGAAQVLVLHVVSRTSQGLLEAARWPLPEHTRYVEPLRLPGGEEGWLALVGSQWQIAHPRGEALIFQPICRCDTVYTHGGSPDATKSRFVYDLNGDGIDEVVLPYSAHLEGYRLVAGLLAAAPLWRVHWNSDKTPLRRHEEAQGGFHIPEFAFRDVEGDGQMELLIYGQDHLRIAALPPAGEASQFGLDARKKAFLRRSHPKQPFPEDLQYALARISEQAFASAEAFLDILFRIGNPEEPAKWSPHLMTVLRVARHSLPIRAPYTTPLPGLAEIGEDDRVEILAAADMDGDRTLDLLHSMLLDYGSIFSQENQLRWYRGRLHEGRLAFGEPAYSLTSDAGSFAQLIYPRTNQSPPLALLLATTEVSLGSIMRALASKKVTLQLQIRTWADGALGQVPQSAAEFTYRDLKEKGRRAMILLADLNGDGFRDYVLNLRRNELTVYLSADAPSSLNAPSSVHPGLTLPSRPDRVLVADLDGDGREELILRYREKYHGALGRGLRVIRLVSQ